MLINCGVDIQWHEEWAHEGQFVVILTGPRAVYDKLNDPGQGYYSVIEHAFDAVTEIGLRCRTVRIRAERIKPGPNWRQEANERIEGKTITNQGVPFKEGMILWWQNLRFRSETERRIARALELTGVLFFPNCMARLTTEEGRANREPDFLVCDRGKWGILEVDGIAFHQAAAMDHKRDRAFRLYGMRVERFPASECYNDAPKVVERFLKALAAPD